MEPRQLYLELLMRSLNGELSEPIIERKKLLAEPEPSEALPYGIELCRELLRQADHKFAEFLQPMGKSAEEFSGISPFKLYGYLNWMNPKGSPDTMCGPDNIMAVNNIITTILKEKVRGDFIETGVWKGGMTVLMRGALKAHGMTSRRVWVADSFSGLPPADPKVSLKDAIFYHLMAPINHLAVPLEEVKELFERYWLLDNKVRFLEGWFCDTLPKAPIRHLALIRMDGDFYDSTMDTLRALYHKLSPGGYLIVDDYGIPCGCREAVDEFRAEHNIREPMVNINSDSIYWRKK